MAMYWADVSASFSIKFKLPVELSHITEDLEEMSTKYLDDNIPEEYLATTDFSEDDISIEVHNVLTLTKTLNVTVNCRSRNQCDIEEKLFEDYRSIITSDFSKFEVFDFELNEISDIESDSDEKIKYDVGYSD